MYLLIFGTDASPGCLKGMYPSKLAGRRPVEDIHERLSETCQQPPRKFFARTAGLRGRGGVGQRVFQTFQFLAEFRKVSSPCWYLRAASSKSPRLWSYKDGDNASKYSRNLSHCNALGSWLLESSHLALSSTDRGEWIIKIDGGRCLRERKRRLVKSISAVITAKMREKERWLKDAASGRRAARREETRAKFRRVKKIARQ